MSPLDHILESSLRALWKDPHVQTWRAKEHDWVSYYAHRHLVRRCRAGTPFFDFAQVVLEGGVPQPPGYYDKPAVRRDVVIWRQPGATCWGGDWQPLRHPLAIVEWKVHRPGHRNPGLSKERTWLQRYCEWQPRVTAYAVEVDGTGISPTLTCTRFKGKAQNDRWLCLGRA